MLKFVPVIPRYTLIIFPPHLYVMSQSINKGTRMLGPVFVCYNSRMFLYPWCVRSGRYTEIESGGDRSSCQRLSELALPRLQLRALRGFQPSATKNVFSYPPRQRTRSIPEKKKNYSARGEKPRCGTPTAHSLPISFRDYPSHMGKKQDNNCSCLELYAR